MLGYTRFASNPMSKRYRDFLRLYESLEGNAHRVSCVRSFFYVSTLLKCIHLKEIFFKNDKRILGKHYAMCTF